MRNRVLVTLLCLAAAIACGKAGFHDGTVRFRISSGLPQVRAAFSGVVTDGVERIDWEKDDLIRVCSPQASGAGGETHWADYKVSSVREDGSSSLATVEPVEAGLYWGEGAHDFYAVCPSPADADGTSLENGVYHGLVPIAQNLVWEGADGLPDRKRICLLAATWDLEESREEPVRLAFRPMFTALSFTLSLEDKNPVPITSFRLESSSGPVAGPFRITMEDEEDWRIETDGETAAAISIGLDRMLEQGTPLTFTVLCLPLDLSGLKAVFETDYGTKSLTLSYQDGSPIVFPACRKARITGLVLPGAPDISFTVDLTPWEENREEVVADGTYVY